MRAHLPLPLVAGLLGVTLLTAAPAARATTLSETTLGKLVSGAKVILVGRVARVVDVPADAPPALAIAEVEVVEWIAGEARAESVWFLAEGTSSADIGDAVPGERALLFLEPLHPPDEALDEEVGEREASAAFRDAAAALTGGAPLLQLCWAGHGRMPVDRVEGMEYAAVCAWHVHLPLDLPSIPGADPRLSEWRRRVPFPALLGLVRRRLAPLPDPGGGEAAVAFDLLSKLDADTDLWPSEEADALLESSGEEAVPALLALLDDPAFPRRDTVAEALIFLDEDGLGTLLPALRSKVVARRRAGAFAIEWGLAAGIAGGDEPVVEALLAAAGDPDDEVRAHGIGALVRCGVEGAGAALSTALKDESIAVRRSGVRALVACDSWVDDLAPTRVAELERALLALAGHPDVAVRRECWEALSLVAGPATLPAGLEALGDADQVVRVSASRALGRTRAPEAAERLIALLGSEDAWARRAAANALGVGGFPAAVGPLTKALAGSDAVFLLNAVGALSGIGPPAAPAVPELERLLARGKDPDLAYAVEQALAKIRG